MRITMADIDKYHRHYMSIGLGKQSTATALMIIDGEIPKPDCFIFADTGMEREGTYENFERLKPLCDEAGIPFHVVSGGNIETTTKPEMPFYINPSRYETVEGRLQLLISDVKKTFKKMEKSTTLFAPNLEEMMESAIKDFNARVTAGEITDGYLDCNTSVLSRQCTYNYKITPISKFCRKHLGAHFKRPVGTWIGISTDEWTRMTTSRDKSFVNFYPLVDYGISLEDCKQVFKDKGYPEPVKSACVGCPNGSNDAWSQLTDEEIARAARYEKRMNEIIQADPQLRDKPYFANGVKLHDSMEDIETRPWERHKGRGIQEEGLCGQAGCFL